MRLGIACPVGLLGQFLLTEFGLLVLLDEGAAATAAGCEEVGDETALEVVLSADIGTLEEHGDPMQCEAR